MRTGRSACILQGGSAVPRAGLSMGTRYQKAAVALILMVGFLACTALPELLRMGTGTYAGFVSLYSFRKYEEKAVATFELLPYIVSGRLKTLLFLWMSSYTAAGVLFHIAYAWWLASSAGMLVALFMLRDGYEGILLFFCCLFPQWILYGAMWQKEMQFLLRKWRRNGAGAAGSGANMGLYRKDLKDLAEMIGLCLLGCAAEAFLGTWSMKIFLQYFT